MKVHMFPTSEKAKNFETANEKKNSIVDKLCRLL
jgi:hypothetical protein